MATFGCFAGSTSSINLPVFTPVQPAFGGGLDAFVAAFTPTGSLALSTYYGGTRSERGRALALNGSGKLILSGQTFSPDLPVVRACAREIRDLIDRLVPELRSHPIADEEIA